MNRYSSLGVRKLSGKRVSMGGALGHGLWAFIKHYLFKHGYRDGWAGFVIALGNFEGTFYRYAKRYEEMKGWSAPSTAPLRRPPVLTATSMGPTAGAAEREAPTSSSPR